MTRLLKLPEVMGRSARKTTSVYARVKRGTMPPPLKRGRSSFWVEHEVDAVLAAEIAGQSDEELRALVAQLVARRKQPLQAA